LEPYGPSLEPRRLILEPQKLEAYLVDKVTHPGEIRTPMVACPRAKMTHHLELWKLILEQWKISLDQWRLYSP
jgi:serine protease inhibitor ecotin